MSSWGVGQGRKTGKRKCGGRAIYTCLPDDIYDSSG